MINQAAAEKYFANENPVGQRMGSNLETASQLEIVGVVRDVNNDSVRDAAPPTMFVPYTQTRVGSPVFEVRTAQSAAGAVTGAVREAMRQIDQNLPMMDVSTQLEQVEMRFQQEKFFAQAYTLFGVVALLLASLGLFGLMSYNVARRTNEIGIRMALGAQRRDVLKPGDARIDASRHYRRRRRPGDRALRWPVRRHPAMVYRRRTRSRLRSRSSS